MHDIRQVPRSWISGELFDSGRVWQDCSEQAKVSRKTHVVEQPRPSVPVFLIGRGGLTYEISEVAPPALASSPEQKPLAREFEAEGHETTAERDRRLEVLSKASKQASIEALEVDGSARKMG